MAMALDRATNFVIDPGSTDERGAVRDWLAEPLELVASDLHDPIITAWTTAKRASPYERLSDVPAGRLARSQSLTDHILEVARCGLCFAAFAESEWGVTVDRDSLVAILVLHDVDKPILLRRSAADVVFSRLGDRIPHGVLGALILQELGFSSTVVNTVATHSDDSPFRADYPEAWILHYADAFATDHVVMAAGEVAAYQKGAHR